MRQMIKLYKKVKMKKRERERERKKKAAAAAAVNSIEREGINL
jgi:hypothetical protein